MLRSVVVSVSSIGAKVVFAGVGVAIAVTAVCLCYDVILACLVGLMGWVLIALSLAFFVAACVQYRNPDSEMGRTTVGTMWWAPVAFLCYLPAAQAILSWLF